MKITLEDHSDEVLAALESARLKALEECGLVAEGYAKKLCPAPTGNLRNSITHKVNPDEKAVYIGTNVEYATYVEIGTGVHSPAKTSGYWVYVVGNENYKSKNPGKRYTYEKAKQIVAILRSQGLDAHMTDGRRATPYIKPAVADHIAQYNRIIEQELKGK